MELGVPAAVGSVPQTPFWQAGKRHSFIVGGQSVNERHCTQLPAPSQKKLPMQLVPVGDGG